MPKVRWEDRGRKGRRPSTESPQRDTGVVRIDAAAHAALRKFAALTGIPVRVLVSRAVDLLGDDQQFSRLVAARRRLEAEERAFTVNREKRAAAATPSAKKARGAPVSTLDVTNEA